MDDNGLHHNILLLHLHLFLLSVLLFTVSATAQSAFPFVDYNDENGLSNNYVSAIYQDSRGFIWIGTQYGLNKFDGHDFKGYTSNSKDTIGLKANWVLSITEAKDSTLWIGTYKGGLSRFDPVKEVFTTFMTQQNNTSIHSDIVNKVKCDSKGRIWVGTPEGVSLFIPGNNSFKRLTATNIVAIEEDSTGRIWILTEGKLMYYDESDQSFNLVKYSTEKTITSITADKKRGLWVLLDHDYLIRLDNGSDVTQLRTIDALVYTNFTKITKFNTFSSQPVIFTPDKKNIADLIDKKDKLLSVIEDHQNNIWIGTESGIKFWSPYTDRFSDDRFNKSVSNISTRNLLLDGDYLWYIEDEVLYKWNILDKVNKPKKILDNCSALFQAKDRAIYTYSKNPGNLYKIDPDTHKTKSFYLGTSANIFSMAEDKANRIWIGVWGMLSCFDLKKEDFVLKFKVNEQYGLTSADFLDLLVDDEGNLWMGDVTRGLFVLPEAHNINHKDDVSFENYIHNPDDPHSLSNNLVQALHKDNSGNIWIGTDAGLNKFRPEDKDFRRFSKEHGLTNDKIITITNDASGRLWMGTISGGLFCLDTSSNSFQNFTTKDGLHSNDFRLTSVFRSPDDILLFGTESGIQIFHPDNIFKEITYDIPVYLTELWVNGEPQSIATPPDSLLTRHINFTKELTLKPRHNTVTFRFAALHYSLPEKTEYYYRLEGIHDTWQYAGKNNEVTFNDLPPGKYMLTIKADRKDLGWTIISDLLTVTVLKPWWKTWWAWLLYIIIFIITVSVGFIFRLQRLKAAQKKAAQLRELVRIKNESFDNIDHELRSSRTLILNMNEQIIDPGRLSYEKIEVIVKEAKQKVSVLLHHINQLLDLAKSETADTIKLPLSYIQDDIIAYLESIVNLFYGQMATKNIQLDFDSKLKGESPIMDYDPGKLLSVINNVLFNAFKYTSEKGKVSLYVNIVKKRGKKMLQLKVRDTGIGIPADKISYIFNRFYQVNNISKTNKGSGIGLALAKKFIESMNGTISVKSEPGQGSEFMIRLPVSRLAPIPGTSDEDVVKEKVALYPFETNQPSSQKAPVDAPVILIIEDDWNMVKVLETILGNTYLLQKAYDGREGIEKAIEYIPDIIISDVMMPGKNGFEVCNTIRNDERTSHIPIILLTAKVGEKYELTGIETGADDYITKPFNNKILISKVAKLIALRQKLRNKYSQELVLQPKEITVTPVDEQFLMKIQGILDQELIDPDFSVEKLSQSMGVSRMQLHRKLKALTDSSPSEFLRSQRLKLAVQMIRKDPKIRISEVGYSVGFNNMSYFTECFKEMFHCTPSEYAKKKFGS